MLCLDLIFELAARASAIFEKEETIKNIKSGFFQGEGFQGGIRSEQ